MDAGLTIAREARTQHRHELRTLTYVTLDHANGGIVRNLSHYGIGAQMVAALRPQQQVRVRFELRYPRLRVDARGEVVWSTLSGQCGIRFLDLSPRTTRQINEWIFGNLLMGISPRSEHGGSLPGDSSFSESNLQFADRAEEDDGLIISAAPLKVIELPPRPDANTVYEEEPELELEPTLRRSVELDWLSQPLSGRSLAWTVNALVVVAALLLFVLVFLAVTGEPPKWPWAMSAAAALVVGALYWGFFRIFGGTSPGARLARLAGSRNEDEEGGDNRFR